MFLHDFCLSKCTYMHLLLYIPKMVIVIYRMKNLLIATVNRLHIVLQNWELKVGILLFHTLVWIHEVEKLWIRYSDKPSYRSRLCVYVHIKLYILLVINLPRHKSTLYLQKYCVFIGDLWITLFNVHSYSLSARNQKGKWYISQISFLLAFLMRGTPIKCILRRLGFKLNMARREARCRPSLLLEVMELWADVTVSRFTRLLSDCGSFSGRSA